MTDRNGQPPRMSRARRIGKRLPATGLALALLPLTLLALAGCVVEVPAQRSADAAPGYGYTCYAGVYVCRLPQQVPVGTQCSCPGIGAPSFGTVR